jgi:hypothetical protein
MEIWWLNPKGSSCKCRGIHQGTWYSSGKFTEPQALVYKCNNCGEIIRKSPLFEKQLLRSRNGNEKVLGKKLKQIENGWGQLEDSLKIRILEGIIQNCCDDLEIGMEPVLSIVSPMDLGEKEGYVFLGKCIDDKEILLNDEHLSDLQKNVSTVAHEMAHVKQYHEKQKYREKFFYHYSVYNQIKDHGYKDVDCDPMSEIWDGERVSNQLHENKMSSLTFKEDIKKAMQSYMDIYRKMSSEKYANEYAQIKIKNLFH